MGSNIRQPRAHIGKPFTLRVDEKQILLSGSDLVEAIEQENGVPVDDVLRPANSSHGAFESAPVPALGLCNVVADPAIVAELSA